MRRPDSSAFEWGKRMIQSQESQSATTGRSTTLFLTGVIGVAVAGYCVGIGQGVPQTDPVPVAIESIGLAESQPDPTNGPMSVNEPIVATEYSEMRQSKLRSFGIENVRLEQIPQPAFDPLAEPKPLQADKLASTRTRASRRAFNGAPPIIPHAVQGTSDAACYACHGKGLLIDKKVAGQMSHGFLANCTQCHALPPPVPFASVDATVESTFVGLPAPTQGKRAYPGAPPTIPHSTWMRESCLACHGGKTAWLGLQSTHPWRSACQQCHAPSNSLEQGPADAVGLLPAIPVISSSDATEDDDDAAGDAPTEADSSTDADSGAGQR